jgi:hypothetical protein
VIDSDCVERRPLGASAWSKVAGREYDELTEDDRTEDGQIENDSTRVHGKEKNEDKESWRLIPETPENERLLPGESQRDRYFRVQRQKGIETETL